jgi:hypothetical protein
MGVRESIHVDIHVNTSDEQLVVPYCQVGEEDDKTLCYSRAHLEVAGKEGWRPVGLRYRETVLGDLLQRSQEIAPNSGHDFTFVFSKNVFAVERRQRLRVVFDAWHDNQSMNAGVQVIKLTSRVFSCP